MPRLYVGCAIVPAGTFWWEKQRSELAYAGSAAVLYLYRRLGIAHPDTHGWKISEDVFAFFDAQLGQRGWSYGIITGDPELPESRLLPRSNLKRYTRAAPSRLEPEILVSIWPSGVGIVEGFHVALIKVNPSLLKRLAID